MIKRLFDILVSFCGLLFIFPLLIIISIIIKLTSKGPVFFRQKRVGLNMDIFKIFKFRTMKVNSDKLGLLTVGDSDARITKIGYFLRKSKLDELPQLINVLIGDMSFVGPRPEVKKYVDLYTNAQKVIFKVRPGITDAASIAYRDENVILATKIDPEKYYVETIMPHKLKINLDYLQKRSFFSDIGIILKTFKVIIK